VLEHSYRARTFVKNFGYLVDIKANQDTKKNDLGLIRG
jgi:hypothetical protein